MERRLGQMFLLRKMRTAVDYRVSGEKNRHTASITLSQMNSALQEHGTDVANVKRDDPRQNIWLDNMTQVTLAQLEPMSFRSYVEVVGSGIAPPPEVKHISPIKVESEPDGGAKRGVEIELESDVKKMLDRGVLRKDSPIEVAARGQKPEKVLNEWMNAWQEFRAPQA